MMGGGKIIPGTETKPDKNGVYKAEIEVDGVKKIGISTFFPKEWDRSRVLDAIGEVFLKRICCLKLIKNQLLNI